MKKLLFLLPVLSALSVSAQKRPYYLGQQKDSIIVKSDAIYDSNGDPIGGAGTLQEATDLGDSTTHRIKAKTLVVGLGQGMTARDTNGIILHGWTDGSSYVYGNGQGAYGQVVGVDSSVTTISGTAASVGLWNSGGTATVSGFRASAKGVMWKSATFGLGPVLTISGIGASFEGYIAQTHPSWTKPTKVVVTGSGAKAIGLYQGSIDVLLNDGGGFASCDCRDSGLLRVTENGAAFIGGIEQGAEAWSNGGGTMLGGLFNKGYAFSGRGSKDAFSSSKTDHGTLAWGATYFLGDVFGAYGDGGSNHGIAYVDSCVAMGDTNSHVMGMNVRLYGSHSFGFGRGFRTTGRDLFTIGWDGFDFQVDGQNDITSLYSKHIKITEQPPNVLSQRDTVLTIENDTLKYTHIPLADQNCSSINLTFDILGVTCHDSEDGLIFPDTTGLTGVVDIFIDGVAYDENTLYSAGKHLVYARLTNEPSCSKLYFLEVPNYPSVDFHMQITPATSPADSGSVMVWMSNEVIPNLFVDGMNTPLNDYYKLAPGNHTAIVVKMNGQFSGWCGDTVNFHVPALDSNVVSSAGTLSLSKLVSNYVFEGSTTTWTLPPVAGHQGVKFYWLNTGTGSITLNSNSGLNEIKDLIAGSLTPASTGTMVSATKGTIYCTGTYWVLTN